MQKFYIRSLFKSNEATDITNIKAIFKNKFNIPLKLTNNQILYEKHIALGTINNLDIIEICKKISNENLKVNIKTIDIFYEYKYQNNKTENREQKVIVITTEYMEKKLKDEDVENFFIDVTYKIIPKKQKNYKLLTISGLDNITVNTFICALILIQYEDVNSFENVFRYLHNLYKFNPKVVQIDYSLSLRNALLTKDLFNMFYSLFIYKYL